MAITYLSDRMQNPHMLNAPGQGHKQRPGSGSAGQFALHFREILLDIRLPDTSGLELQKTLSETNDRIPIIFITGHGDVPMSVQTMKAGAMDFLLKPFRDQDLLEIIQAALRRDRARRDEDAKAAKDTANYASLTAREREIMQHVVTGQINKQIAADVGLSEVTVKIHRAQVMRKMGAASVADLVRIADRLKALG